MSHGWFDVPLSKIRSRSVNANAFVIARDQLAQQSGSSLAEEKSWYDVYCMRLQSSKQEDPPPWWVLDFSVFRKIVLFVIRARGGRTVEFQQ